MRLIFLYLDYLYLIRFLAILQRFSFVSCKNKEHRIHTCNIIYGASESQESNVNRNKFYLSNQQQQRTEKKI